MAEIPRYTGELVRMVITSAGESEPLRVSTGVGSFTGDNALVNGGLLDRVRVSATQVTLNRTNEPGGTFAWVDEFGGGQQFADYFLHVSGPAGLVSLAFSAVDQIGSGFIRWDITSTQRANIIADTGERLDLVIASNTLDVAPSFGTDTISDEVYTQGTPIATLQLPAAVGGNAPVAYTLTPVLPAGLVFDAVARHVTGTPTATMGATEYTYTATDVDGDSDALMFSITVQAGASGPSAPQNLDASSGVPGMLTATWQEPADDGGSPITSYDVRRRIVGAAVWTTVGVTSTSYVVVGLPGGTYEVQVLARNVNGDGPWTASVQVAVAAVPQVVPRVQVRIAFETAWNAGAPVWVDVTDDASRIEIRRGRQYELDRVQAGALTVTLDNRSGDYYPGNLNGQHSPHVLPRRRINVRGTWAGVVYDVFDGYVSRWLPRPDPTQQVADPCAVECYDGFGVLARSEVTHSGFAQSTIKARLDGIMDLAGWPTALRRIDTGQVMVAATGAVTDQPALVGLRAAEGADLGLFFMDRMGRANYQDRSYRARAMTMDPIVGRFSPTELPYFRTLFELSDTRIINRASVTRAGGTLQSASDATSQQGYGTISSTRSGVLLTSDLEALSQAQTLVARNKDPYLRAQSINVRPHAQPADLYPIALASDLSDRIEVIWPKAGLTRELWIEGVRHTITNDDQGWRWDTRWELSAASTSSVAPVYWQLGRTGSSELGATTRLFTA